MKSIKTFLKESMVNENIGDVNDIVLYWENDYELWSRVEALIQSMLKKEKREKKKNQDFELSEEYLMNSSIMKQMVRDAIKKYSKEITELNPTTQMRKELAKEMTDTIFYSLSDWREND